MSQGKAERIANRIKATTGKQFEVEITPGSHMDAAALDKGNTKIVKITEGAEKDLTEDELAWVIAHETAHFAHNDTARRSAKRGENDKLIHDAVRKTTDRWEQLSKEADRGAFSTFVGGILAAAGAGAIAGIAEAMEETSASRQREREADAEATEITRQAGFDAAAGSTALHKLDGFRRHTLRESLFSTHPESASRAKEVQAQAKNKEEQKRG